MKTKLYFLGLLFGFNFSVFAQVSVVSSIPECEGMKNGSLAIVIDPNELEDDWELPFEIDYINITTGNSGSVEVDTYESTVNNLATGEFELTLYLSDGCEFLFNGFVDSSDPFSMDVNITNSCNGISSGEIEIFIEAGSSFNQYFIWDDEEESTTESIENLSPGTYCVTVTDDSNCNVEDCYTVDDGYDPNFTIQTNSIDCICPGGYGAIDISITGDSGPYTYQWTGEGNFSSQEEDAEVWEAGYYSVEVTNTYGCVEGQTFIVSTCDFNFTNFQTNISHSCGESNTGSIELITGAGAIAPYQFIWENAAGDNIAFDSNDDGLSTINNLAGGEYCVTVVSANGCEASACGLVIEAYELPTVAANILPLSDYNANDGFIDLTVSGGDGPYQYQWSNGAVTEDVSGLSPGVYTVDLLYGNSYCSESFSFNVFACSQLAQVINVSAEVIPISGDEDNGAINLTIENAEDYDLNYLWTGTNTGVQYISPDISGLAPDVYCVTISSANCQEVLGTYCYEICGFGLDFKVSKFVNCDFTYVIAMVTGTDGPYSYQWSNGSSSYGILAYYGQEYCITVTDNNGCVATRCITVAPPEMALSFAVSNASLGASNGAVTANLSSGIFAPFSYVWDNGMTGQTISGLFAGEYCVTITDNCGRTISDCTTVECEIQSQEVDVELTNVACGLSNGGIIDLSIQIEPGTYNTYVWSNGAGTEDINGLAAGEYCVTVVNHPTDCEYNACYTIEANNNGDFKIEFETEPACNGGQNGSITASVTEGGVAPYTYEWAVWNDLTGLEVIGNAATLSEIPAGIYTVWVTDALGCSDYSWHWFLPEAPSIDFDIELSEAVICAGATTDASVINITGGTAPYSFEWTKYPYPDLDETGSTVDGLSSGWYIVKVTDDEGCNREKIFIIIETQLTTTVEIEDACWPVGSLGSIEVFVSGGQAPISYHWDAGFTTSMISAEPGIYTVTITDGLGCTLINSYEIADLYNPRISPFTTVESPICPGLSNGAIDLHLIYDTPNPSFIEYEWSNGATTQDINGLPPGEYTVTVTGDEGCSDTRTFNIVESFEVYISSITNPGTPYTSDGSINIEVIGEEESEPYSFNWSNAETTEDIFQLSEGSYTVTITDVNNCTLEKTIFLTACSEISSDPITLETIVHSNYYDPYQNNGAIDLFISGGSPPLYVHWTNIDDPSFNVFFTTNFGFAGISNLVNGDYQVTVTDGCSSASTWRPIRNCTYDDLEIEAYVIDICPLGNNPGSIVIYDIDGSSFPGGNVGPYTYKWTKTTSPEQVISTSMNLTGITVGGTYCVEATSYAGCMATECFQVIKTYESTANEWANGQCSYLFSCPDTESFLVVEDLSIELLGNNFDNLCVAKLICPIDESEVLPFEGVELWTEPNEDGGFCYATLICRYDIGVFGNGELIDVNTEQIHQYDCNDNSIVFIDPPNDGPGGNGPGSGNGCPSCVGSCSYSYNDDCTYNEICSETGDVVAENIPIGYDLCIEYVNINGNCGYNIWEYCPMECDKLINVLVVCDNDQTVCNESPLNNAVGNYGYSVDCSNGCCADLINVFEICEPCKNLLPKEESGKARRSDREWLESFRDENPIVNSLNISVYPNPFTNNLFAKIDIFNSGNVNVKIIDILGKEILNQSYEVNKGSNIINLSHLNGLNTGVYQILIVDDKGNHAVQKVIYQSK